MRDAILKAGPVRLRPILMTTIAMILGMMPSAMGSGEGSEFRSPISIATIGGLITSTMLTLVVVPVAYLLLARTLERVKAWRASGARVPQMVRVTGVIVLIAVLGWLISATSAFAQSPNPPLTLTFNQALERAMANNEGLKGREGESRRDAGARAGVEDQLSAASEPGLQLHAVAKIPGHPDSGGCLDQRSRRFRPASRSVISSSYSSASRSTPAAG